MLNQTVSLLDPLGLCCLPQPPTYKPDFWNNDPNIRGSNNCYSYAINRPFLPDGTPRKADRNAKPQPGFPPGSRGGPKNNCDSVKAGAKNDGLIDPDKCGECPTGWFKVYLVVDPDEPGKFGDYHWYRQDEDGTWSHKRGTNNVRNVDAAGKPILDPSKCDRNYPDRNYSIDCGTLCAPN